MDIKQCDRCGEQNHGDAGYCGTCGLALASPGDVASLVDDTTPGDGPGAVGLQTSEYVGAPVFGETGPVSAPAPVAPIIPGSTTVAPPPAAAGGSGPPQFVPPADHVGGPPAGPNPALPPVRFSNSTSVMIAALAVAIVVIIGGVFILLARGGDTASTSDAKTGDEVPTPAGSPTTVLGQASTVPVETLAPVTAPQVTAPPVTAAQVTAPPVTAAQVTAAPPAPTSPPPAPPTPTRGAGDLNLAQPILNEACDGRYITFVGSAVGDQPHTQVVSTLLNQYPGTNYIWTKSCPSLRQEFTNGEDIYGVVFGPYVTQQEACNARAFGPVDAYVRRISTFDPQDHTIRC